ncbi:MAG: OB-fold nucleic acid binding domain-containing protein [Propionibacteriaceae bacterium]
MTGNSGFSRIIQRFAISHGEIAAQERRDRVAQAGADAVTNCCDRDVVRLVGELTSIKFNPSDGPRWLEAEFDDGSGHVRLVWMGRRSIKGIDAGRRLAVEGRISCTDGRRTIYNPRYELLP